MSTYLLVGALLGNRGIYGADSDYYRSLPQPHKAFWAVLLTLRATRLAKNPHLTYLVHFQP